MDGLSPHRNSAPPAIPVPAATILLLRDDPFEVLMIRRHEKQFFSSALVFPGGLVHEDDKSEDWLSLMVAPEHISADERALYIAGFRELYEEAGVLLARAEKPISVAPNRDEAFIETVRRSGGRLFTSDLVRCGHWITPAWSPKRFDTHFFLARMPADQEATCDGAEAVAMEWAQPTDILARAAAGENAILFPTRSNVARLAEHDSAASVMDTWRQRTIFTVRPSIERRDGGTAFMIPAEAGYPDTEFFLADKPAH